MRVHFFDNTDPDGMDLVLKEIGSRLETDARRRHLQIGRHHGDAQRHARGRRRVQGRGARLPQALRRRDRRGLQTRPGGGDGRLARAFPDVGLGRRPHLRALRRRPAARRAPGHRDRRSCSPAPPRWTSVTRRQSLKENPAALLALMWYFATDGRGRRTWSCCPTRTACSSSPATCSSSSWSRSARNSTCRAAWSTRASPFTATRAPPTSMPTSSSSARA